MIVPINTNPYGAFYFWRAKNQFIILLLLAMSSLPAGFFDDESQQLVAEGVSLKKQSKNIENSLNNEVNTFLDEVVHFTYLVI